MPPGTAGKRAALSMRTASPGRAEAWEQIAPWGRFLARNEQKCFGRTAGKGLNRSGAHRAGVSEGFREDVICSV